MADQNQSSLYERLGGVYNIATVVDDFIDRIMVDSRLNANPRVDEAHHRVLPPGFKYLVTEMVCEATGGPQKYTGRSMHDSHKHLQITAAEWEAFLDDFKQSLDKFEVPQTEQAELKAIVASTKADIVVSAAAEHGDYGHGLSALAETLDGELLTDGPQFDGHAKQWNAAFDAIKPAAIAMCNHAQDVAAVMKWLQGDKNPVRVSVRSSARGGHLWSGYSVCEGGLVIDVSRLNSMSVIEGGRYARLGPGVEQGWANRAMAPFHRMFPTSGDCNQFAFGGFVQGGGFSLFARGHGLAADYLVEATVVLADGSIVVASENNEYADLLWGLRGGGAGNFGIVTEMLMDTFQVPARVLSMEAYWALPESPQAALQLLKGWRDVHQGEKNTEFGGWLALLPGDPYEFRLLGVWAGDDTRLGWEFWNKLQAAIGLPLLPKSQILELTAHDAVDVHQSTFAGRNFFGAIDSRMADGEFSNTLLEQVIAAMYEQVGDGNASYIWIFFPHGGAVYSMDPDNSRTAFGNRNRPGDICLLVVPKDGKDLDYAAKKLTSYSAQIFDAMSMHYYPGHPPSMHAPKDVKNAYYDYDNEPHLYAKLCELKAKYDPNNVFRNPVTIDPETCQNIVL